MLVESVNNAIYSKDSIYGAGNSQSGSSNRKANVENEFKVKILIYRRKIITPSGLVKSFLISLL